MSKLYGTVKGQAETSASRRGTKDLRVSAQTYDGSVIVYVTYERGSDTPRFDIEVDDGSSNHGKTFFSGSLDELKKAFRCYDVSERRNE